MDISHGTVEDIQFWIGVRCMLFTLTAFLVRFWRPGGVASWRPGPSPVLNYHQQNMQDILPTYLPLAYIASGDDVAACRCWLTLFLLPCCGLMIASSAK